VCHPYDHPKYLNACSVRSMFMDQKGIWLSFFFFFFSCLACWLLLFEIILFLFFCIGFFSVGYFVCWVGVLRYFFFLGALKQTAVISWLGFVHVEEHRMVMAFVFDIVS